MDEMNQHSSQFRPRRRRKTKWEIFKEAYFPVIIVGTALLLILIFIIGSIIRSSQSNKQRNAEDDAAIEQQALEHSRLEQEADQLILKSDTLAKGYRYDDAIAVLDSFSGDMSQYQSLMDARDKLVLTKTQLVAWNDPAQITNLSLQMLIADPERAFNDDKYSYSFTRNFLTTNEFNVILDKLYTAGYVLVNIEDVFTLQTLESGATSYQANTIYLPHGKRPLILTQTNVNYHTYLTNSDEDKLPDAGGRGFASKLVFNEAGELTCEYIDSTGQVLTGEYDMIPILNRFVREHPDFSYQGAKAVIALTGYDGLFGYRTNSAAEQFFGTAFYDAEIQSAKKIAEKLRSDGYELACYTFENVAYGNYSTTQVSTDISGWTNEVVPILGDVKIFAFAQNSDIADEGAFYNSEKYTVLANAGFSIFLGFSANGNTWSVSTDSYVRQGRILLSPTNIQYHPDWFNNALPASEILDPERGNIPT